MRTAATIKLNDMAISTIQLGFVGESNHNKIVFDCEAVFSENPSAVQSITVTPPVGDPYPVVSARVGNNVEWIVGDSDVAVEGDGKVQLTFVENNETIKSYEANTTIMVSSVPGQEPTAIADWITAANATLEEVDEAIPTGGTKGQVLAKASNADRDTEWVSYSGSYNDMSDKPQIEGVTLSGDVSLQDLGAAAAEDIPDVSGFYTKPESGIPASDLATGVIPDVSGFYSKPQTGIPATDIADGVIPDVSGFYTKPSTGIPASDLATGVIPDVSGYYTKPTEGIPDTDMSTGVRTSLGKADSAYQKPGSGIPAGDLASGVIPDVSGFYTKPAGGIPASDIADGVIPDPTDIIDDTAGDGATQLTWSADKIKEETDELKEAVNKLPETKPTNADSGAFDIADSSGNVVARLQNGHIKTQKFDSEKLPETKPTDADSGAFDIADSSGNVVARFQNGYIKTQKFDSTDPFELPSYYPSYLDGKCAKIKELMSASNGGDAFFFITDQHMTGNAHNSFRMIKYIAEKCRINKLFSGGDLLNGGSEEYADEYRKAMGMGRAYFLCGNHEYLANGKDTDIAYWYTSGRDDEIGNPNRRYFYIDNPQAKIRYIVLNSYAEAVPGGGGASAGYEQDQLDWMTQDALSVDSGWLVVILTHSFWAVPDMGSPEITITTAKKAVLDLIDTTVETNNTDAIIIQGHTHVDAIRASDAGIPVVITTCDKWKKASQGGVDLEPWLDNRVPGTITEQAFDVCVIDKASKKMTAVRVGAFDTGDSTEDATLTEVGKREINYQRGN